MLKKGRGQLFIDIITIVLNMLVAISKCKEVFLNEKNV